MKFLRQVFQSALATIAIMAIVGLLMLVNIIPYNADLFVKFLIGAILVIFGKSIFLSAIDNSIIPVGKSVGSALMHKKNIWLIIVFGFLFGLVSTIAEPDVQVMVSQITTINPFLSSFLLLSIIGIGCGFFVCFGLVRILKGFKLKWIMLITYGLILVLAFFCPREYFGLALDGGGSTTGAVAVPFLLALTVGICAIRGKGSKNDSFGIISLTSCGPVIALLILGIICGAPEASYTHIAETSTFGQIILQECWEVFLAFLPLVLTFLVTQFTLLKLTARQVWRIIVGFLIACVGLVCFLTGVYYGFGEMANYIGNFLGLNASWWLILLVGLAFGFAIVYTEPAISVLAEQVEEVTIGFMKKKVITFSMAIGVAVGILLAFVIVLTKISLIWVIAPLYVVMLVLTFLIPKIFVGIAFDSGGTAPGTMLVAFILPICFGMCETFGLDILLYGFGIVGLVATIPIIVLEVLGLIYKLKRKEILEEKETEDEKC